MTADASSVLRLAPIEDRPEKIRLPLLQQYLNEQQELTAVERFAQRHAAHDFQGEALYKAWLPLERPKPGEQYAFQVDLDACTGCKACVTACHHLNGLDDREAETWRSVGLLHGGTPENPLQQTVTTACHHCLDPACMKGCPVGAYEKDPETGIVRHLDDQCIGCQYCTLTCPYDVPQYSKRRGIVRKCDMCSSRLAVGEAPACVQACPNQAISIRIASRTQLLEEAQGDAFLPGAPSPSITLPTTAYVTERALPKNMLPADYYSVQSGHQHLPLVVMLVLTQLSVGAFGVALAVGAQGEPDWAARARPYHALAALALGLLALGASTLHLGRPWLAFRAVIGVRTSWLSREILAFGVFAGTALVYAALLWQGPLSRLLGFGGKVLSGLEPLSGPLGLAVLASGAFGILCSVSLYAVTGRRFWGFGRTLLRFGSTALVLGIAITLLTTLVVSVVSGFSNELSTIAQELARALWISSTFKLLVDVSVLAHLRDARLGELKRTALLLLGELRGLSAWRVGLGLAGGVLLPLLIGAELGSTRPSQVFCLVAGALAFSAALAGELCERALFFKALSAPRMPGAFGP